MLDLQEVKASFPSLSNLAPLGQPSGQKEVLRGTDGTKPIVLKLVKANAADDKRTERELAAMAIVASNYVPKLLDHGKITLGGTERYYIVEQYIDGASYREVLRRQPKQSLASVINLASVLLEACRDFQAVKIVHRDLKPENLIVDRDGKLWVIDFGLARHLELISITPDGGFGVGTLGYAAPEQFQNIKAEIDVRTDLYAVGIILYEAISGSHPFLSKFADGRAVLRRMESTEPPLLTIVGDSGGELSTFISALLQRFPSRRPQTAEEACDWFCEIRASLNR